MLYLGGAYLNTIYIENWECICLVGENVTVAMIKQTCDSYK